MKFMPHRPRAAEFLIALLAWTMLAATEGAAAAESLPVIAHRVTLEFDVAAHSVQVLDEMDVPPGLAYLRLGDGFNLESIMGTDMAMLDPQVVVHPEEDESGPYQRLDSSAMGGFLLLKYSGTFHQPTDDVVFSRETVGAEITATIGPEGIYMSSGSEWLAGNPESLATFDVTVTTPLEFEPVTQGRRLDHTPAGDVLHTRWQAVHPSDGLNLIANRFVVHELELAGGIVCYTYFLDDDPTLRATYEERTAAYLEMYAKMIGPYPYAKFATVENWFPTGYGMPSYTLLGGQVLRLPFIPYTSFGHEICHNWWGNSVFVDSSEGNWCEGLTVYCADYHYKELESAAAAREYRRNLLKDYAGYVQDPDKDFPLSEFMSRHSGATRAIGYGKSMMVFHMIDRLVGHDAFLAALRTVAAEHQYLPASWGDFLTAFGAAGGQDLASFRPQWLERTGAPSLALEDVAFADDQVSFTLRQSEPTYILDVPVVVGGPAGDQEHVLRVTDAVTPFVLKASGATRISVDPDCHLFRRLDPAEIEPTLRQVFAHDDVAFTTGEANPAAREFAEAFTETDDPVFSTDETLPAAAGAGVMINPSAAAAKRLLPEGLYVSGATVVLDGKRYDLGQVDLAFAVADPDQPGRTLLLVYSRSPRRLAGLANRLSHYGKYSWLVLPSGRGKVERGNWPAGASPLAAQRP